MADQKYGTGWKSPTTDRTGTIRKGTLSKSSGISSHPVSFCIPELFEKLRERPLKWIKTVILFHWLGILIMFGVLEQ